MDLTQQNDYEILNGNPLDVDSHALDMRTSAGIYWAHTQDGKAHKKGYYTKRIVNKIGEQFEFDHTKPEVQEFFNIIKRTEDLGFKNIRTLSICKDCIKDEQRPIEKQDKPRLFKTYPFDKVYLMKKWMGKFKTEWTKKMFSMFHAVGINPISAQWSDLYFFLRKKNDEGCDADFGRFDKNERPEVMALAGRIIRNTIIQSYIDQEYDEKTIKEIGNLIDVLIDENIRTISVSGRTVYADKHGNPSGSNFTTIMNCMVNFIYHWYCFIKITGKKSLGIFMEKVAIITFGDDVVFTTVPEWNFDFASVAEIMNNELEQDYTDAAKSKDGANKKIKDLRFLKRGFKNFTEAIIFAPIEKQSIEMRFNYTNIAENDFDTHYEMIENTLLEVALHGGEYFAWFSNKLRKGIRNSSLVQYERLRNLRPVYSDYLNEVINTIQNA
jgi:hypothetical protein